jgi:HPt (histidine-containing phosphotransfer) domain-containing protein
VTNTLRVLLVGVDSSLADQICARLASASHSVFAANDLEEASEALDIQRFDAVLLGPYVETNAIRTFTEKLRRIEAGQRQPGRATIFSFQSDPETNDFRPEAYLPPSFDPAMLTKTIAELRQKASSELSSHAELPVFDLEKLQSQTGNDRELMIEIAGLFLHDHGNQMAQMRQALDSKDYTQLSYLAHTLKGSLGTLGGVLCWYRAQQLEWAAKQGNEEACRDSFRLLEAGLATFLPHLHSLCNTSSQA